jgi:methionine sulfoxide reductase catalytic subunit
MKTTRYHHIVKNEITDPEVFYNRRKILKAIAAALILGPEIVVGSESVQPKSLQYTRATTGLDSSDATPFDHVKNYTNYYEFGVDKEEPAKLAQALKTNPWSIEITGEVEKPLTISIEDLLNQQNLQEFVYRHRCVEGWSMVVPWLGFPLGDLLKQAKVLSSAKFVKFVSVFQPDTMPSQKRNVILEWPYVEALRIDEATHPLTILSVGMYGTVLPKQNGAPIRLVVPWKYGFKSIKAIVKLELTRTPPITSWQKSSPKDYGFYANVNPSVPHSRWSQISEIQLGSRFFTPRRKTELFNGYGEQVASLYSGMDLRHFF